ncbi:hypothetical protein ACVW0I_007018 [Bradyrhizobium sp. LM6.11]
MRGFASDGDMHEDAALAPRDDIAGRAARLGIEHGARGASFALDHRPGGGRADLLVRGDQHLDRVRAAAEFMEGGRHEYVHDDARLHVGNARTIGALVLNRERTPPGLALAEHGVAMSHQQHRLLVAAGLCDVGMDRIAEGGVVFTPERDAVLGKMPLEPRPDRIDAFLVIGPGIDVHDIAQQVDHRLPLRRQPVRDLSFRHVYPRVVFMRGYRALPADGLVT